MLLSDFRFWGGGQPDNHNDGEDCAELRTDGMWNDLPCTAGRGYLCERPNGKRKSTI